MEPPGLGAAPGGPGFRVGVSLPFSGRIWSKDPVDSWCFPPGVNQSPLPCASINRSPALKLSFTDSIRAPFFFIFLSFFFSPLQFSTIMEWVLGKGERDLKASSRTEDLGSPQTGDLARRNSWCLSFPICKMDLKRAPASWGYLWILSEGIFMKHTDQCQARGKHYTECSVNQCVSSMS